MLDTDTKRRIDSCRDILVGKVPDPKSQVEQITIALIYKFMDDMDAEAEELGGARSFFAGDHAKYGWAKLMAPSMGGFDVLALYSEAIGKMNENPGVPPLFRDIFKNAYLPYRDPETLRAFLKEINGFTYDHSERLGDAFEYLLSVLGSQGDAGQFRTPRHIIDFMVEIIAPKKNESILDPACGTAGFLISAWKHILKHNTSLPSPASGRGAGGEGAVRAGDLLTPDERQYLAANIHGYDISPDMVRLSLVNLYLHGFTDPHVVEYDTLTSEEKWNETADIILANPPFMSPKGGIKPHKRFSVQATRSEVLFVDYMAEHLSPQGRAAIVVPEGIIFQSGTAYKKLREMLVKTSLAAVISLPAGVFNPYSGVKTSILILDKRLAKTSDSVLFVKVENDGYNLGAQRRAVTGSDLLEAQRHLREFFANAEAFENSAMAHKVERARIGENGEWNLSGDRYAVSDARQSHFDLFKLSDVCELIGGSTPSKSEPAFWTKGTIKWISSKHISDFRRVIGHELITQRAVDESSTKVAPKGSTILITRVSVGKYAWADDDYAINQDLTALISRDKNKLDPGYLFHIAGHLAEVVEKNAQGIGVRGVNRSFLSDLTIPLPPLAIQQEIVAEIDGYQKIIDGARQVVENYRPRIVVQLDWPLAKLAEVCEVNPKKSQLLISGEELPVSFVPMADLAENEMLFEPQEQRAIGEVYKQYTYFEDGDVLLAKVTPCFENGKAGLARRLTNGIGFGSSEFFVLRADRNKTLSEWIYLNVTALRFRQAGANQMTGTGGLQRVPREFVANWEIPLPDLDTQRAIVAEIEAEQVSVNSTKELIARFEAKIKTTINRVWGEAE